MRHGHFHLSVKLAWPRLRWNGRIAQFRNWGRRRLSSWCTTVLMVQGAFQTLARPLRTVTTLDRFAYVRPNCQGHEMRYASAARTCRSDGLSSCAQMAERQPTGTDQIDRQRRLPQSHARRSEGIDRQMIRSHASRSCKSLFLACNTFSTQEFGSVSTWCSQMRITVQPNRRSLRKLR